MVATNKPTATKEIESPGSECDWARFAIRGRSAKDDWQDGQNARRNNQETPAVKARTRLPN